MNVPTMHYGWTGAVVRAIGLVDIAMWHLHAQVAGLPAHEMPGGYSKHCEALITTGHYDIDLVRADEPLRPCRASARRSLAARVSRWIFGTNNAGLASFAMS